MFAHDPYAQLHELKPVGTFTVTSTDFADGETLPKRFWGAGAGGEDVSPELSWSGFPPETKSFAVTCYDPDAPTASGWWHWAVANLPARVTSLETGAGASGYELPNRAVTILNEGRNRQYNGPTPPAGTGVHRYFFVVHALDVEALDLPEDGTPALLGFLLHFHTLARGIIVGLASGD
ncbi:YbhB/YbcL family Raf kinase inhibitor-like protein [Agromyces protaetiae]|uniref:YbhB/YbcL family Raf kinase inhibitor-like protein n=1 Tax=Agromyces protaetiae TaxID=2509455 RepID=A0A4V0YGU7_9MICO|nr:YbhB/YbcL family Raf kinase inhibitor-like protein [Agromyces protaetiae]QAY72451.1 YbhB/YbcL family Raf kinase inhibitor-like protein [Agromyces protaetiae]